MSAIWLLSTRGRPQACQEVLDACEATGMTSPGLVYVDETVDEYKCLRLPPNWRIHRSRKWGSIAASMRYCLKRYPDATQYGWLADDNIPVTDNWDKILEEAAGEWFISCARDLWFSELQWVYPTGGPCFTSGLCWGAELIRSVGWWSLPGVRQGGIDGAWNDLAGLCGLTRYLPEVIIEHRNWQLGKRAWDETDNSVKHGLAYIANDLECYERWVLEEREEVAAQIRAVLPPGSSTQWLRPRHAPKPRKHKRSQGLLHA